MRRLTFFYLKLEYLNIYIYESMISKIRKSKKRKYKNIYYY